MMVSTREKAHRTIEGAWLNVLTNVIDRERVREFCSTKCIVRELDTRYVSKTTSYAPHIVLLCKHQNVST